MSRPSKTCVTLRTAAAILWSDPRVPEGVRQTIAADPLGFIRAAAARPLKIGRATLVLQTELPMDDGSLAVVVKQYSVRGLWKALAALFRPAKAAQNWAKAEFLRAHGIATPRPLLACRVRSWRTPGSSFLVTEWISAPLNGTVPFSSTTSWCPRKSGQSRIGGSENLHLFGWQIAPRPVKERLRLAAACAEQLGRLIGRMHAAGAVHRDLKAANFLVAEGTAGVEVWLVDLDGLRIGRRTGVARRGRDLARLAAGLVAHPWVTRSICLRFLRAYESQFPRDAIAWRPLWRAIADETAQIVRRKQQRGERVL